MIAKILSFCLHLSFTSIPDYSHLFCILGPPYADEMLLPLEKADTDHEDLKINDKSTYDEFLSNDIEEVKNVHEDSEDDYFQTFMNDFPSFQSFKLF